MLKCMAHEGAIIQYDDDAPGCPLCESLEKFCQLDPVEKSLEARVKALEDFLSDHEVEENLGGLQFGMNSLLKRVRLLEKAGNIVCQFLSQFTKDTDHWTPEIVLDDRDFWVVLRDYASRMRAMTGWDFENNR